MSHRRSVRAIIVDDGRIALIERRRGGDLFYVFPGGSIERGESARQALVREVEEELGVHVEPQYMVAEVTFSDRIQTFWLAEIRGGQFGTGTGPEMTERPTEAYGTFRPIWMPVSEIPRHAVRPARIAQAVVDSTTRGWPSTPPSYEEADMWWRPPPDAP